MRRPNNPLPPALRPRGVSNVSEYPTDRTRHARVFLRDSDQLIMDTDRLSKTYIIDARFISSPSLPHLNRDITRALPRGIEFELSHLSGTYYLLAFNSHITHNEVMMICDQKLNSQGYVFFLWTPAVNSKKQALGFKVWVELLDLPPHCWSIQELPTLTASFGLILAHTPLSHLRGYVYASPQTTYREFLTT
jgi:Domain of unknown function (DUF4283)